MEFNYNPPETVQQGWQCPVCKRVYAPWMAQCLSCGGQRTVCADSTVLHVNHDDLFMKVNKD